ncbi:MAG: hypothetical protein SCH66_07390 [Methanolobus sp.]|nr:hypothetical protein [Methanolobus sp.]
MQKSVNGTGVWIVSLPVQGFCSIYRGVRSIVDEYHDICLVVSCAWTPGYNARLLSL